MPELFVPPHAHPSSVILDLNVTPCKRRGDWGGGGGGGGRRKDFHPFTKLHLPEMVTVHLSLIFLTDHMGHFLMHG